MAECNKGKAEEVITKLKQEELAPGNGQIVWLELDLSDPRNAEKTAQEFLSKESRLDVLIHNAAILLEGYCLASDGMFLYVIMEVVSHRGLWENIFILAYSVISPFVLTRELLPVLGQTAAEPSVDVRIVVLASDAHKIVSGEPRFRNIDDTNNEYKSAFAPSFTRYCYSKLANILNTSELQRRLNAEGSAIMVISLHPGIVNTFSSRPQYQKIIFAHLFSGSGPAPPESAQNRDRYKGAYPVPVRKLQKPTQTARGEGIVKELWEMTEGFLADNVI
ncbi:hypothetical protein BS17DRAFT_818020 [Gyrodon lividus]|nr:hypothetical protein BS17DRAFT_818020 [Gyrodon lividus]